MRARAPTQRLHGTVSCFYEHSMRKLSKIRSVTNLCLITLLIISSCSVFIEPLTFKFIGSIEEYELELERQDSCEDYIVDATIINRKLMHKIPEKIEQTFYLFEGDNFYVADDHEHIEILDTTNIDEIDSTRILLPKCCYTVFDSISMTSNQLDTIDLRFARPVISDCTQKYVRRTRRIIFHSDTIETEVGLIEVEIRDNEGNVIAKLTTNNSS